MEETPKNHEDDKRVAGVEILEEMKPFSEHMAEMEGAAEKAAESTAERSTEGATEGAKKLDPFWDEHPELLTEAKEFGAPLTIKEFKEEGYSFGKDNDGKPHIMAPTTEYAEWLSKPSEEKGNFEGRRRESLEDRRKTPQEKLEEALSGRNIRGAYKRVNNGEFFDRPGQERFIRETIKSNFDERLYLIRPGGPVIKAAYRKAYREKLKDSSTDVSNENVANAAFRELDEWRPITKNIRNEKVARAAETIMHSLQKVTLKDEVEKSFTNLDEQDKQEIEKTAAETAITLGEFMPEAIATNPEKANEVLRSLKIDKNQDEITLRALNGYENTSEENSQRFAEFFDLNNRIAEMVEGPGKIIRVGDNLMRPESWDSNFNGYIGLTKIPEELTDAAMEKIGMVTRDFAERLRDDPELETILELGRKEKMDAAAKEIVEWDLKKNKFWFLGVGFDFGQYLDTKRISVANTHAMQDFLHTKIHDDANTFARVMDKGEVLQALGDASMEFEPNYKDLIRDNLLERIESGIGDAPEYAKWRERVDYDHPKKDEMYLTEIFETDGFKENKERLGIDFNDPAIMDLAFNGFLNTLGTVNGEETRQADWYYENIFANDPARFISMVAAYRNSKDAERGLKGKLTKFFNNNPQAFADRVKQEAERRFQEEINSEKRGIRTSVLRAASRDDIKQLIEDRQRELLEEYKERGVERISTFTGQKTLRGEQEEREPKERKEAPFDFGIEKVRGLQKYANYIELNYPNSNLQRFIDTFPDETEKNGGKIKLDSTRSYIGFSFEYDGKTCAVAESFGDPAGMYLYCDELGSDFKKMFDMSKFDAERDPNIAVVDHLDKDHFDEDLDTSYQKAFMFFKSGDKGDVLYKNYNGQMGWRENQKREFPAWPVDINSEYQPYPDGLAEYQAWHERQDSVQDRLRSAIERGGPEEVDRENRRIANEDYDATYEEQQQG